MRKKKNGSFIFDRKELMMSNCEISVPYYPLIEYDLYILLENKDSVCTNYAEKIAFIALGAFLQLVVYGLMAVCIKFSNSMNVLDSLKLDDLLSRMILVFLCTIIAIVLFICGRNSNSEKKQLVSKIRSYLKEE